VIIFVILKKIVAIRTKTKLRNVLPLVFLFYFLAVLYKENSEMTDCHLMMYTQTNSAGRKLLLFTCCFYLFLFSFGGLERGGGRRGEGDTKAAL
jgi:hypothetical protein